MMKCDQRAKARCPYKNPCCGEEDGYYLEGSDCDKFNQKITAPPLTNADRIRAMSDEELAKKSSILFYGKCKVTNAGGNALGCLEEEWRNGLIPCDQCALDWLSQPAEED